MSKSIFKTFLKIAFAPFLWLLHSCSPLGEPVDKALSSNHYYSPSKDDIIYSSGGNWLNLGRQEMHADVKSFEVLDRFFGRDKKGVYFKANRIENPILDANSFYTKSGDYPSYVGYDKEHVYIFTEKYKSGTNTVITKIVENADPESYVGINPDWAKDRSNHFYHGTKVDIAYDSFKILNDYFVRDSSHVYVKANQTFTLLECDQASFRIFQNTYHGMDKTYIYWLPFLTRGKKTPIAIPHMRIEKINYMNNYYLSIGSKVYCDGTLMPGVNSEKFSLVRNAYGKDEAHVYYKGAIVPDADAATFEKRGFIIVDKNGRYEKGKIVGPVPENIDDK